MKYSRFLTFFSLLICYQVTSAPVWKVSNGAHHLYIGGTIHLLSAEDYPLPEVFDEAYQSADTLVFETDIQSMQQPNMQQKMQHMMSFQNGKTIQQVLSKDTYKMLQQHLSDRGIPIQSIEGYKPGFLAILLTVVELSKIGMVEKGVDEYYSTLASKDGKKQDWFETPEFQIALLADLGKGNEDQLIRYTLADLASIPDVMSELVNYWREGDMKKLSALSIDPLKQEYQDIYEDLIVNRNKQWVLSLETMLSNKDIELVLVGAMHLAGPDSVLVDLANKGYKIEKL